MCPSELSAQPRRSVDWRGWLILAWALWFATLYAKMVVERRGSKLRTIVGTSTRSLGESPSVPVGSASRD